MKPSLEKVPAEFFGQFAAEVIRARLVESAGSDSVYQAKALAVWIYPEFAQKAG